MRDCSICKARAYCWEAVEPGSIMCGINLMQHGGTKSEPETPRSISVKLSPTFCAYCGKPLKKNGYGAMACGHKHSHRVSSIECRYHPRKRPSPDAVPKRRRKTKSHLALCIEEARARGLSYGQYMAWKFTKGESEV